MRIVRLLALAALVALGGCAAPSAVAAPDPIDCASGTIAGQGSSAQANAMNAWIRNYQVACPSATVAYTSSGSGAGVRAFLSGSGNFAGSDSAIATAEQLRQAQARCRGDVVHLPMVVGPIALAYNVAGVGELRLSAQTVADIFAGRITAWNSPAVAADNPGVTLPATRISPVHRSDNSGTTDNFTKYLAASADWPYGRGSTWSAPGGLAQKGSNRVVSTIERTDGAIGYVEASYARFNNLPIAAVGNAGGAFVPLTDEAAARTVAAAAVPEGDDLKLALDYRISDPSAYPIVLVSYEIICKAGAGDLVKSFLTYASSPAGQSEATTLGYAPLPDDLRDRVAATLRRLP